MVRAGNGSQVAVAFSGERRRAGPTRLLATLLLAAVFGCSEEPERAPSAPPAMTLPAGQAGAAGQSPPTIAPIGGAGAGAGAGAAGASGSMAGPVQPPGAGTGAIMPDASTMTTDAGVADASSAEPVSCPASGLASGTHNGSVDHAGKRRTYVVHVPSSYTGDVPVPALFDFHGYGSSGSGQMGASGFRALSDEHGFIAVYPDGVGGSWHVNGCCGQAATENLDEVAAVRAILAKLTLELCIDPRRIYASGISQGGGMAHHVGCLAADVFAAVAPVSSDLRTEPCEPARPISQMSFRGTADRLSAYEGGPVGPAGMQYQSIGALPTLQRWAEIDRCTDAPAPTLELCQTHKQCAAGVEVTLCTLPGAGHVLYANPSNFDVAKAAWEMFQRQMR